MSAASIQALIADVVARTRAGRPGQPPLIGVAGAQGSGKSFQCRAFAQQHPHTAHFSIDDVYFTHAERQRLARQFHPLFATRGPPGSHAIGLALSAIAALRQADADTETALPRFDKRADDRAPEEIWPRFRGRPDAILLDGWCLGALPDELGPAPLNRLEAEEDADGRWRAQINADLTGRYQLFFDSFDALIYLKAPDWEIVRDWRAEQESETLEQPLTHEDSARLDRFLMHYERITRSMLGGRHRAHWIVHLDRRRAVTRIEEC